MYYSNSDVRVEEKPVPEIGDKDVLIKVMASGICGTDIMEWYRIRKAPMVQGHEIAGIVEKVGKDITNYKPGDRVFATHHVPCDSCRECYRGNGTLCESFQKVNNFTYGGFAEYVRVSGRSVETGMFKLPDSISYEQATFIEPLGTVIEGTKGKYREGDTVLVLGSGIAGLLNIKFARKNPVSRIIATDFNEKRLESAKEFGADEAVNAKEYTPDVLRQLNEGRLADLIVICASSRKATEQAHQSMDPDAQVIHFATPPEGEKVELDFFSLWRSGFRETVTYGATPRACYAAFELIKNNIIQVDNMITHRLSLDQILEGFRVASSGEGLKVIIEPHKEN